MVKSTLLITSFLVLSIGIGRTNPVDHGVHPVFLAVPTSIAPGGEGQVTLTVDVAGSSDTTVSLTSSNTSELTMPSTVTVPSGETSVSFNVQAPSSATSSATVTATANEAEITSNPIPTRSGILSQFPH